MLEFLTSLASLMKSFSDFVKKHVSFYAVLLTCAIVSYVAFAFERTTGFLYFGIGCTLFFFFNFVAMHMDIFVSYLVRKRVNKILSSRKEQRAFLKSLTNGERNICFSLFLSEEPKWLSWADADVRLLVDKHCLCYVSNIFVPYGGNLGKYCSLQSWLYRCIEDNEDWFMSLVSDDDISDMSEQSESMAQNFDTGGNVP